MATYLTIPLPNRLTLGETTWVADRVAAFGGSWTFIIIAIAAICGWMIINVIINKTFDPYPYIFLNLVVLFGSVASADHHDESESSVNP